MPLRIRRLAENNELHSSSNGDVSLLAVVITSNANVTSISFAEMQFRASKPWLLVLGSQPRAAARLYCQAPYQLTAPKAPVWELYKVLSFVRRRWHMESSSKCHLEGWSCIILATVILLHLWTMLFDIGDRCQTFTLELRQPGLFPVLSNLQNYQCWSHSRQVLFASLIDFSFRLWITRSARGTADNFFDFSLVASLWGQNQPRGTVIANINLSQPSLDSLSQSISLRTCIHPGHGFLQSSKDIFVQLYRGAANFTTQSRVFVTKHDC